MSLWVKRWHSFKILSNGKLLIPDFFASRRPEPPFEVFFAHQGGEFAAKLGRNEIDAPDEEEFSALERFSPPLV